MGRLLEFSDEIKDNIRQVARQLGFDERKMCILESRCLGERTATLQELADEFGVTRERVRSLEANMRRRIIHRLIRARDGDEQLATTYEALKNFGALDVNGHGAYDALTGSNHPLKKPTSYNR